MSLRARYTAAQQARALPPPDPIKVLSGEGKTRLVAIILDPEGNPRFDPDFPADLREKILAELKGN